MPDDLSRFTIRERGNGRRHLPEVELFPADRAATADAVAGVLAAHPMLFDRNGPTMLVADQQAGGLVALPMEPATVSVEAHRRCRFFVMKEERDGRGLRQEFIGLSERYALLYLRGMVGNWRLRPLYGIASTPLLTAGGDISTVEGYDREARLWLERVPAVTVPGSPTREQAEAALRRIRLRFRTFPFADARRVRVAGEAVPVVELEQPPGADESAFLAALLGAVCRPSLWLAPGTVLRGANLSGAGSGKGLLARAISLIAFGRQPRAMPASSDPKELDKQIAAGLIGAQPVLFLDNLNEVALSSSTLASAMTERPAQVRPLGRSAVISLNSTAFVLVTGNALSLSEDLARRFIVVELDPQVEDPESRPFASDFLIRLAKDRAELLTDLLTIWRWGQQSPELPQGRPLGSYEVWARWVRDPLLALGCCDPVARIELLKAQDPRREEVAEIYRAWWSTHGGQPVAAAGLGPQVLAALNPQRRGRQYIAQRLKHLVGTRAAGFVLTAQPPAGKWTASTYQLQQTGAGAGAGSDGGRHRTHRTHGDGQPPADDPMGPMGPMPDALATPERDEEDGA